MIIDNIASYRVELSMIIASCGSSDVPATHNLQYLAHIPGFACPDHVPANDAHTPDVACPKHVSAVLH